MRFVIDSAELRRRRTEARLSRRQLSERTIPTGKEKPEVSQRRIEQLENADEGVRGETVHALAAALSCDPSDISHVVEEVA